MRECVLDASVVLDWFTPPTATSRPSAALRAEYEAGDLQVVAPPLIHLEIVNVAGRRWAWTTESLQDLAMGLEDLSFDLVEPTLATVARWVGAGLTAYDAAYVAVAEDADLPLLTRDSSILDIAPRIARRPSR